MSFAFPDLLLRLRPAVFCCVTAAVLFICSDANVFAAPPAGYYQVWGDEFNGSSLDTTKWDYWLLGSRRDAVNTSAAVSVSGGVLTINTYTTNGTTYTAMVANDTTFRSRYGYWEASIKWGDTNGMWSAIWMQSPTMGTYLYDPFVSGSEIDISEHRSTDGGANGDIINVVQPNVHWNGYGGSAASSGGNNYGSGLGSGFHTYGFLWTPTDYTISIGGNPVRNWNYSVNGVPVSESTEWMVLSSEVQSGLWSGTTPSGGYGVLGTSTTQLQVDYIRYYVPTNTIFWSGASSVYLTNSANYVSNMPPLVTSDLTFSFLSGANLSPTLGGNLSVDSLVFLNMNGGCVVGGTNTLTIGGGGVDMVAANHSVTINCPVNISTAQTWLVGPNSPGNTLTDNGGISGSATLSKGSYGTLVLTGSNSFTGTLNAGTGSATGNDGALQLASSGAAANAAAINIPNNNGGSSVLQLTGGITVPPPVTLSGRNTNAISIENVSGSNTFAGSFTITTGGANYWLQSDAGTLNFGGTITSAATGTRALTFMGSGNFNISGAIQNGSSTTMNLMKNNSGLLTLANANTFAGTSRVLTGTEILANTSALQNATVDMNADDSGLLSFGSLTSAVFGSLTGSRDLALTNASAAAVALATGNNNQSTTFAGIMSGSGSLNKTGSGTFTLTSSNTYAGGTVISGGTLKLARDPVVRFSFENSAGSGNGSVITNTGTSGSAMNGTIVGAGASVVSGGRYGNALSINGAGGTAATNIVLVNSQGIQTDGAGTWTVGFWIQTTTAGAVILYQGDGTWSSNGQTAYLLNANSASVAGTHAGAVRWAGGFLTGTSVLNDGNWHFITLVDRAGTETIYVDGAADSVSSTMSLALSSLANQMWIGGSPDVDAGAVKISGLIDEVWMFNRALSQAEIQLLTNNTPTSASGNFGGQLPAATALTVASGAAFDLGGNAQTIASLSDTNGAGGWVTNSGTSPVTLTINSSAAITNTFTGVLGDTAAANALSLVKNGNFTEILVGTNTYRGTTTVNAGALLVNGRLGTNAVTLAGGRLGGNGVIGGALLVQSSATLAPGASIGVLTCSNNVTLQAGSTNYFELNKTLGTNDQLRVSGALAYAGTLSVTNLAGSLSGGDAFKLFSAASVSGNFTTLAGAPGAGLVWKFNPTNGVLTVYSTVATNFTCAVTNNALLLSWPADHLGWMVQAQTNNLSTGLGTNWISIPSSATNTQFTAPLDVGNPSVFYRLIYQ